jgi:hypothetical protein
VTFDGEVSVHSVQLPPLVVRAMEDAEARTAAVLDELLTPEARAELDRRSEQALVDVLLGRL